MHVHPTLFMYALERSAMKSLIPSLLSKIAGGQATASVMAGVTLVSAGVGAAGAVGMNAYVNSAQSQQTQQIQRLQQALVAAQLPQKQTKFASDDTTDVLIDAPEVDEAEIDRVVKHGDHWHVFTKDGREIITYKDPTHAHSTKDLQSVHKVLTKKQLKEVGSQVVKLLKHGDHWHVYTADGNEFITYSDPRAMYPHAQVGVYTGSHGAVGTHHTMHAGTFVPAKLPQGAQQQRGGIVQVVDGNQISRIPITKILKHGDHYHCYTANGTEYVTYDDPSPYFPGVAVGTYVGNHGTPQPQVPQQQPGAQPQQPGQALPQFPQFPQGNPLVPNAGEQSNTNSEPRIVRVLRHQDHWHCYTADGREFIYYGDAPSMYPSASVGEYTGPDHGSSSSNHDHTWPSDTPSYPSTPTYPDSSSHDHESSHEGEGDHHHDSHGGLIEVHKGLDAIQGKTIVKILKHEDHWHCYDNTGKEYVVHTDPKTLFPEIIQGEYEPKIPDTVTVTKEDMFTYADVPAENKVKPEFFPYEDLKYMRKFNEDAQTFYAWHMAGNPHIHKHSIEDIIRAVKWQQATYDKMNITARDIVATLKYYMEHPEWQAQSDDYQATYNGKGLDFQKEHTAVSAIKDKEYGEVFYWVKFDDNTYQRVMTSTFKSLYSKVPVEDYSTSGDRTQEPDDIKKAIIDRLGIDEKTFDDAWLALGVTPSMHNLTVDNDGSASFYGMTVPFLNGKLPAQKKVQQPTSSTSAPSASVPSTSTSAPAQRNDAAATRVRERAARSHDTAEQRAAQTPAAKKQRSRGDLISPEEVAQLERLLAARK